MELAGRVAPFLPCCREIIQCCWWRGPILTLGGTEGSESPLSAGMAHLQPDSPFATGFIFLGCAFRSWQGVSATSRPPSRLELARR